MMTIPRLVVVVALSACASAGIARQEKPAFPGAVGSATPGGRGGRIIKVTTLAAAGPGSLAEALRNKGPHIVVFEVGGVIDLQAGVLKVSEPFLTLAGQTAPSPGISLIRGGLGISTHDVVIQHLRFRAGDAGKAPKSGWEVDSMAANGAWNIVVDHCSLAWATDENLSASGPRFDGATVDEWRGHEPVTGQITLVGNVLQHGLDSRPKSALFTVGGVGSVELFALDNLATDRAGQAVKPVGFLKPAQPGQLRRVDAAPLWPAGFVALPASAVKAQVLANAGARP